MDTRSTRTVVLVEGVSDQRALEALAGRHGRSLAAEGVSVVPIGGAQGIGNCLAHFGPGGLNARLSGLCDAAEERHFRRALECAGLGERLSRAAMEQLGFFVCDLDLEDELIRCLGVSAVERVVAGQGETGALRTLRNQPAWRGLCAAAQLRRFMGTRGGRKIHYAQLLVDALDLDRVPRPLDGVLKHAWRA